MASKKIGDSTPSPLRSLHLMANLIRIPRRKSAMDAQHGASVVVVRMSHVVLHDILRLGAETAVLALFHLRPKDVILLRHIHVIVFQLLDFILNKRGIGLTMNSLLKETRRNVGISEKWTSVRSVAPCSEWAPERLLGSPCCIAS